MGLEVSAFRGLVRGCITFGSFFLILLAAAPTHCQGKVPEGGSATQSDAGAGCERPISLKRLPSNILDDQKPIWLFPIQVAKGKHLKPVAAVALATAGLVALDPSVGGYFLNDPRYANWPNGFWSGLNTALATAIPPHGDFTHTWFKYPGTFGNSGSFPSGHAIAAFSVASVFACRYRRRRWVPWVAYGGATVIALSRIPVQAHFPSDVFVGATLGYVIGHYVVLRQ